MTAGLITDWIFDKEPATCQRRSSSDFGIIVLKIGKGTAANKFVQDMTLYISVTKCETGEESPSLPLKSKEPKVVKAKVIISGLLSVPLI